MRWIHARCGGVARRSRWGLGRDRGRNGGLSGSRDHCSRRGGRGKRCAHGDLAPMPRCTVRRVRVGDQLRGRLSRGWCDRQWIRCCLVVGRRCQLRFFRLFSAGWEQQGQGQNRVESGTGGSHVKGPAYDRADALKVGLGSPLSGEVRSIPVFLPMVELLAGRDPSVQQVL